MGKLKVQVTTEATLKVFVRLGWSEVEDAVKSFVFKEHFAKSNDPGPLGVNELEVAITPSGAVVSWKGAAEIKEVTGG